MNASPKSIGHEKKSQGVCSEAFLLFACCTSVPLSHITMITYESICNLTISSVLCFKHPWALGAIDSFKKSWCTFISPKEMVKKNKKSLPLGNMLNIWRGKNITHFCNLLPSNFLDTFQDTLSNDCQITTK